MKQRFISPLRIGDRFCVQQDSKNPSRYSSGRMRTRRYHVYFRVDDDCRPKFVGGVKPTPEAMREVEQIVRECICPERLSMDRRNSP
jgi:hypothetical protein